MAIPLVAGAFAVGALAGAWGWWRMSAPRVSVEGLRSGATLQRAKLGEQLTIVIRPRARTTGTEVRLDGDALVPQPTKPGVLTVALPTMDDGPHELMVRVRRWGYGDIVRRWKFVLDDTAPTLTVPPEVAPVPIDQPYTLEGSAEAGSTVTVPGADVRHDGDSVKVAFARPPAAPVTVTATDVAGNVSTAVVVVPVVYPGTHA
ncbi:MAG: hypothetical protein JWL70_1552, partial [Acidimicrobiia bacterium]|nr:hypothetical protein [Acidimicrobiia bacterium]